MRIHVGCEVSFELSQTTPMIATLNAHFSRSPDLERPDHLMTNPTIILIPDAKRLRDEAQGRFTGTCACCRGLARAFQAPPPANTPSHTPRR